MPVLIIDLLEDVIKPIVQSMDINNTDESPQNEEKIENGSDYPTLCLYERDWVVEKVKAYKELYPMTVETTVNLMEHIKWKIELLGEKGSVEISSLSSGIGDGY